MTFVAEVLSLKCLVCPDLRDYIGLCFLCSCRACFFLMLSVFKCGKFSKLLSVHREIQLVQIPVVRRSLNICSFPQYQPLLDLARYGVGALLHQVKCRFYKCIYLKLPLGEGLGLFTGWFHEKSFVLLVFGWEKWGFACCFIYQIFDISYCFSGFVPSAQLELVRCGNNFIHTHSAVTYGLNFCQMSLLLKSSC